MKRKQKGVYLNCFSPPVMLTTLIIEFSLAAYTVWRYKMNTTSRLIASALLALGIFQLAEYFVCTGYGMQADTWSRVGFAAITTLPTLGLHIVYNISGRKAGRVVQAAYGLMGGVMAVFLLFPKTFQNHQCTGNYVIFHLAPKLGGSYLVYYYALLLIGILLAAQWAGTATKRKAQALYGMIAGYLVFLVPTTIMNTVNPATKDGLPSIMCGFAVFFALILGFYVLPRAAKPKYAGATSKV